VKGELSSLLELYLHLHRNPELSFQEAETARRIASELEKAGYTVTAGVGGHGVVGILKNGQGPVVMVRSDLDALPIVERTGRPWASTVETTDDTGATVGVMHACGHDIHMTCMIGTARFFAGHRDAWSGTLLFIGQPAEERGSGAGAMIEDGLFDRFPKPDVCLALHVASELPAGHVAVRPGYAMANVDSVDIRFRGKGGHGAYPHRAIDPIVQASRFVVDVQTLVSREIDPLESGVVTVGAIHGGTKHNIIPDECHLQLTVRSYTAEIRQHLLDGIRRKAGAAAQSAGADEPEVTVSEGTPSLYNDDELTGRLVAVFREKLGADAVHDAPPVMGGEDFSRYSIEGKMPSMLFWLGTIAPERLERHASMELPLPSLHSAEYWPDAEPAIRGGVAAMSYAVLDLMPVNRRR
jgi:hippurate hydrolase